MGRRRVVLAVTVLLAGLLLSAAPQGAPASGPAPWLEHAFTSATGWVKPGDAFVVRTRLTAGASGSDPTRVEVTAPPGATIVDARVVAPAARPAVVLDRARVRWDVGSLAAGEDALLVTTLVAASTDQDPRIVWKDLSSTASLATGSAAGTTRSTHGPRVIPPTGGFETARYGDKPFPVVTVAYRDRPPRPSSDTAQLERILNSPDEPGSTFNLYQEMSYGLLWPEGHVPSSGITEAGWEGVELDGFTTPEGEACRGTTRASLPDLPGSATATPRIVDGWYQLPGDTEYYGGDDPVFPYGQATVGVPQPHAKDTACGASAKIAWDAAHIADPEIDYNDYDGDRDGLVDFFMLVHVGCGGNGASQLAPRGCVDATPYDNVWPHSGNLADVYLDPVTRQRGYVSDDQLRSLHEVPQCWLDDTRTGFDDCAAAGGAGRDELPVRVRVGPYNANPEDVFGSASIISHEYGHHLGLPDQYNSAFDAGGTFDLMAADHSQHLTGWAKQELGWLVPRPVLPGEVRRIEGWREVKQDVGEVHWWTPDGEPYVLSAANGDQNVHNGEAWVLHLPGRRVIDPEVFATGGSPDHVWWSGRGSGFGCPPDGGHSLDLRLPELASLAPGTPVTLRFASAFEIEWDFDYGFVLGTADGVQYASLASRNGLTTPADYNPNGSACHASLGNGITGVSEVYTRGEPFAASSRLPTVEEYGRPLTFVEDEYDLTALAGGEAPSVRFAYHTDAAIERPGWFIDDVVVVVDGEVVHASDFEDGLERTRLYPGGCDEDGAGPSIHCTAGWTRLRAGTTDAAEHAYLLELRDRSGFDHEGHGQSQRGAPLFDPGLFVGYSDEAHGYGNNGVEDHPAQHYLDSSPTPGEDCDDVPSATCHDAAFTAEVGRNRFRDDPATPWQDNFWQVEDDEVPWTFDHGCLDLQVTAMRGHDTVGPTTDLVADAVITAGDGCVVPAWVGAAVDVVPPEPRPVLPATGGGLAPFSLALLGLALLGLAGLSARQGSTCD